MWKVFPFNRHNQLKRYQMGNKQLCKNVVRHLDRFCGKAVTLVRNQENIIYGKRLRVWFI